MSASHGVKIAIPQHYSLLLCSNVDLLCSQNASVIFVSMLSKHLKPCVRLGMKCCESYSVCTYCAYCEFYFYVHFNLSPCWSTFPSSWSLNFIHVLPMSKSRHIRKNVMCITISQSIIAVDGWVSHFCTWMCAEHTLCIFKSFSFSNWTLSCWKRWEIWQQDVPLVAGRHLRNSIM